MRRPGFHCMIDLVSVAETEMSSPANHRGVSSGGYAAERTLAQADVFGERLIPVPRGGMQPLTPVGLQRNLEA